MELDAARTGFTLHQKPNQGNIGRSMNIGDLVRLTPDGLVSAWYPDTDHDAVGIVIALPTVDPYDDEILQHPAHQRGWVSVEWPDGRDTHMLQDLDIVRKYFS